MNNQKQARFEKEVFNLIRTSNKSGSHLKCFRCYASESETHMYKKFAVWRLLILNGYKCYTEAILKQANRLDILAVKEGQAYAIEILETETEKECLAKLTYLPEGINKITIKDINEALCILKLV